LYGEPKKPVGYDEYKKAEKEKVFQAYENELATFLRLNVAESVTNRTVKPKKPEGYDKYKEEAKLQTFKDYDLKLIKYHRAIDNNEKNIPEEPKKPEGYDEYVANYNKQFLGSFAVKVDTTNGMLFDGEGIPQYLSEDDHYNGFENPEWTKKYMKKEEKPVTQKPIENKPNQNEKLGINYDEDGIPEYLNAECYHFGEANPEWLKKHEPHNYKP
jgi:hypothetical protein